MKEGGEEKAKKREAHSGDALLSEEREKRRVPFSLLTVGWFFVVS
jgi:hypothetical protein